MAEAIVDDQHPLYEYLQTSGDNCPRTVPGGLGSIADLDDDERARDLSVGSLVASVVAGGKQLLAGAPPRGNRTFAERFKYIIISSPLLSSSIAPIPLDAPDPVPREDNNYKTLRKVSRPVPSSSLKTFSIRPLLIPVPTTEWLMPVIGAAAMASHRTTIVVAATAWIIKTFYHPTIPVPREDLVNPFASTFNAMSDLISANDVWDTLVGKSLSVLDSEEDLQVATPASEPLRTALIAACDSVSIQSDSVRQLFSPLTSPLELSMLSEMYAPAAPTMARSPSHTRGGSASALPTPSPSANAFVKRSTWNGGRTRQAYSELDRDEPTSQDPPSPLASAFSSEVPDDTFGSAALGINRNRRKMREFESGQTDRPLSPLKQSKRPLSSQFTRSHSPLMLTSPSSPLSRYNSARSSPRRPRANSSIRGALDRAVMSRRYAASHLLALRFEEDPLDVYWEDVSSVINLFAKATLDAASSLAEALNEYISARMADQMPTPDPSKMMYPELLNTGTFFPISPGPSPPRPLRKLPSMELSSFAPMPSDLAQFASHMDAMSKSLDTAQNELRACLVALQSPPGTPQEHSNGLSVPVDTSGTETQTATQRVMDAYARLRREIGTALRECERGRAPLATALHVDETPEEVENRDEAATTSSAPVGDIATQPPTSPSLSHSSLGLTNELEAGIDLSAPAPMALDVFDAFIDAHRGDNSIAPARPNSASSGASGSSRNPFTHPDPEQVYEAAVSPATASLREKSKLSRAERIRQMRERRAAGGASVLSDIPGSSSDERGNEKQGKGRGHWGPGGDVVQELKSVISLVSERRRTPSTTHAPSSLTTTSSPLSRSHSNPQPSPVIPEAQLPAVSLPPPPPATTSVPPSPRDEQEAVPYVPRSRTSSAGTTRAPRPNRPPPPPPIDGFDTDTFGSRDAQSSSSHSLPSSPSPPGSPHNRSFDLPPSVYGSASSSPFPSSPTPSTSSIPNRLSALLTPVPPRPPRAPRPTRQLPTIPNPLDGNVVNLHTQPVS